MEVKRIRTLALEIFKSFNDMNPVFMKSLFEKRLHSVSRTNDLHIPSRNTVTYGNNSIRCLGPHIWNTLPKAVKKETNYQKFKDYIDNWFGPKCKCSLCSYIN